MAQGVGGKRKISEKQRIVTPEFRVAYPALFQAKAFGNQDPKFSVVMLFKKTNDISLLKVAMKHAKISAFGPDKDKWPEGLISPIRDGDHPKLAKNQGYAGHWAIKASANEDYKPEIIDRHGKEILSPSDFYAGCYARAEIFAFAWEYMGKEGVSFILNSVIKTKDGERFGGRKAAKDAFAEFISDDDASDDDDSGNDSDDDNDDDDSRESSDDSDSNERGFM